METDSHLLQRYHRQGDALAFQQLVETHAGMVHATASRVTRDAALAQDVAQETFLALARGSSTAIQSVGAWLHHVAWQKARDLVRGESRRQKYEAAAAEQLHQPPEEATWAELEPLLDGALEELPAPARDLLIQRFLVGHTQQDLANRAGLSQSTVSRLLTNAIEDLRAILKSKGVACGSGLAVLLSTRGIEAAPPALVASLGKLALSGVGVSSMTLTQFITFILMKTMASKLTLAAAALLLFATAAYDLGSSDPWLLSFFRDPSPPAPAAKTSTTRKPPTVAAPSPSNPPPTASFTAMPISGKSTPDSPEVRLTKLAHITKAADFKALVLKLFSSGDPKHMASELKRLMGIDISEQQLRRSATSPTGLEFAIFSTLAIQHPRETLAWMAALDTNDRLMADVIYRMIFKGHPEITAESMAATLPAGPNRDQVLSILRSQRDPVAEAQQALGIQDPRQRIDHLWKLANTWPKEHSDEAVKWALKNLSGYDLEVFLPRVAHYISSASPDAVLALMNQITDPKLLRLTLVESLYGLVHDSARMADVVTQIGRLQGADRASAISELTRKWVREDQEGLIEWVNNLDTAADFEAALPMALPQLTPENYAKAINNVMSQLDGTLDAALIKAATPDFSGTTKTTMDIIGRLTQLPQYSTIGAGQQGNQDLLWQAINKVAAGWVTRQGAMPSQGAQWIDTLPFRTPADKAAVAGQLYNQWKVSDPAAATAWATRAGVQAP